MTAVGISVGSCCFRLSLHRLFSQRRRLQRPSCRQVSHFPRLLLLLLLRFLLLLNLLLLLLLRVRGTRRATGILSNVPPLFLFPRDLWPPSMQMKEAASQSRSIGCPARSGCDFANAIYGVVSGSMSEDEFQ